MKFSQYITQNLPYLQNSNEIPSISNLKQEINTLIKKADIHNWIDKNANTGYIKLDDKNVVTIKIARGPNFEFTSNPLIKIFLNKEKQPFFTDDQGAHSPETIANAILAYYHKIKS